MTADKEVYDVEEAYVRPNLVQRKAMTPYQVMKAIKQCRTTESDGSDLPIVISLGWSGYFIQDVELINGQIWIQCFREADEI